MTLRIRATIFAAIMVNVAACSTALAQEIFPAFPPFPASDAEGPEWVVENIDVRPAFIVGANPNLVEWMVPGKVDRSRPGYARAWFRMEITKQSAAKELGFRSLLALVEFDCLGGRSRQLADTTFLGNNLGGGTKSSSDTPNAPWSFIRPDSPHETELAMACDPAFVGHAPPG